MLADDTWLGGYIPDIGPSTLQIDVGRICLGSNAAERTLRGIALRRLLRTLPQVSVNIAS